MAVEAFAPAKINLTLHVTGRRADGYHLLDSLVAFCDIGDKIKVRPAADLSLKVTGPRANGVPTDGSNLVMRAAALLQPVGKGAEITLEKHLPAAAGIGGGSSDAAATLRALSQFWAVNLPDPDRVLSLGADVPVCMAPGAWRMAGIGEDLAPLADLPPCDVVLVNPGVSVSTPVVFSGLTSRRNEAMPDNLPNWRSASELSDWLAGQRNDLQAPVVRAEPVVAEVLEALQACGGLYSAMSGSGATCFALFEPSTGEAQRAQAAIETGHPEWWVASGRLMQGRRLEPQYSGLPRL